MSKKLWMGIAAVAIVAIAAVGLFKTKSESLVTVAPQTVIIGYRTHDLYAPVFVGIEQKIFEKYGLDVKTVQFASTNQLTDALIGGSVDAALGGVNIPLILTIQDKSPGELVAFSLVNETPVAPLAYLLVTPSSTIATIADLRGKKVGAFQGSTAQYLYRKTVSSFFKPEEAELVQMNPELELAALASGQVAAVIVLEPLATIGQSQHTTRVLESGLFDKFVMPNFPNAASVMAGRFKRERPDVAKALVEATDETIDFINSHPAETRAAIAKFLPFEAGVLDSIRLPYFIKQTEIKLEPVQQEADLLYNDKQLKKSVDVKGAFSL
ncbi:MAG: ABC transporter substrate-binding protein [Candidatus Magasanikbacteria bacterium]|nr:ABC transporter substrate-binding protein [Candidatus Magasanikbacteria bacterium]